MAKEHGAERMIAFKALVSIDVSGGQIVDPVVGGDKIRRGRGSQI